MLLHIENLFSSYGGIKALQGVSLDVNEGETVAVLGPNGAGKSTLLKTISVWFTRTRASLPLKDKTSPMNLIRLLKEVSSMFPKAARFSEFIRL
jgi:ABC-type branched-subunit amino acid transport system ATPase component